MKACIYENMSMTFERIIVLLIAIFIFVYFDDCINVMSL